MYTMVHTESTLNLQSIDFMEALSYKMVRREGLEPSQAYAHKALNLARLPIPPPPRGIKLYQIFRKFFILFTTIFKFLTDITINKKLSVKWQISKITDFFSCKVVYFWIIFDTQLDRASPCVGEGHALESHWGYQFHIF